MDAIKVGQTGTATMVVGTNDTAPRVGSGAIAVLATPVMINLIEEAALDAIESLLPDGYQTLGMHLDVSHIAATPVGMTVTAKAVVDVIDKRRIEFVVQVHDAQELVGEGRHTRIAVSAAKFQAKIDAKASA